MASNDFLREMQHQINITFESQDPELFDVVFEIDGNKLYANKFLLSIISSTFKSMLSERWTSKNESIKIETYKFEDFKELLTFIYSGKCSLSDENIFTMLDISEFYQIKHFKQFCDEYLSKMELGLSIVFQLIKISAKYPNLNQLKKSLQDFITENIEIFVKCDEFLNADQSIMEEFVSFMGLKAEESFQAVFQWAEYRAAMKNQKESNNFSKNDAIKNEIIPFLHHFEFKKMKQRFFHTYIVERRFLFTDDEFNDLLESIPPHVKVKITNQHGHSMYGYIPYDSNAVEAIKSLKIFDANNSEISIHWVTNIARPSTPCLLKKKDGVQWYLFYFFDGDIGVMHCDEIVETDYYLLAEMNSETDFIFTDNCKIEIE